MSAYEQKILMYHLFLILKCKRLYKLHKIKHGRREWDEGNERSEGKAEYISHSIAASNKQVYPMLVQQNKGAGLIPTECKIHQSVHHLEIKFLIFLLFFNLNSFYVVYKNETELYYKNNHIILHKILYTGTFNNNRLLKMCTVCLKWIYMI